MQTLKPSVIVSVVFLHRRASLFWNQTSEPVSTVWTDSNSNMFMPVFYESMHRNNLFYISTFGSEVGSIK